MLRTMMLVCMVAVGWATGSTFAADPDPKTPAIKELLQLEPNKEAFKGGRPEAITLTSEKEAAKYFSEKDLAKLKGDVDFAQQTVLLFAWEGSGQDKLTSRVAESFPEQITFSYRAGLTRDLRPHVYIYAVRSNVKWSVK